MKYATAFRVLAAVAFVANIMSAIARSGRLMDRLTVALWIVIATIQHERANMLERSR